MDMELVKTYKLLEASEQTQEVVQIKNQIKESLHHQLKTHFKEVFAIGHVIGLDSVQDEFTKALQHTSKQTPKSIKKVI